MSEDTTMLLMDLYWLFVLVLAIGFVFGLGASLGVSFGEVLFQ